MENNKINLKEKTVTELKALAYDLSGFVSQYQQMLNIVQNEINSRQIPAVQELPKEKKETPVVKADFGEFESQGKEKGED